MKPSAYLINTSRGDVVNAEDLVHALRTGVIAGAALDVYVGEPSVPDAFKTLENVVLLPHLGSATIETRTAMGMRVLENLKSYFTTGEPGDRIA
jgi:lactate dehydrogenase-like 2-hydroxyacid dehydrogenase